MTKPVLPPCSVAGCKRAAGAIINEMLQCGEHAVVELNKVIKARKAALRKSGASDNGDYR